MPGPLAGIRVVEIVGIGPAPAAAMWLADMGADVVRIDRPIGSLRPAAEEFDFTTRGRQTIVLDLKDPSAVDAVLQLVQAADVLIEGFRPGVMERLGLGPAVAHSVNSKLVYGRVTGWGQFGPLAPTAGHDVNFIALTGVLDAVGRAQGPPQIPLNLVGDFAGGTMYLVAGVLAALLHVRAGGGGQVVDAAITDGVAHLASTVLTMQQAGSWGPRGTNLLDSGAPFYAVYETADDTGWVAVGAIEPRFYDNLIASLGVEDLPDRDDPDNWPAIREAFESAFRSRTRDAWEMVFQDTDACVTPVLTFAEAYEHPHHHARETFTEVDGVTQPNAAPRFSLTPTSSPECSRLSGPTPVAAIVDRWRGAEATKKGDL